MSFQNGKKKAKIVIYDAWHASRALIIPWFRPGSCLVPSSL